MYPLALVDKSRPVHTSLSYDDSIYCRQGLKGLEAIGCAAATIFKAGTRIPNCDEKGIKQQSGVVALGTKLTP